MTPSDYRHHFSARFAILPGLIYLKLGAQVEVDKIFLVAQGKEKVWMRCPRFPCGACPSNPARYVLQVKWEEHWDEAIYEGEGAERRQVDTKHHMEKYDEKVQATKLRLTQHNLRPDLPFGSLDAACTLHTPPFRSGTHLPRVPLLRHRQEVFFKNKIKIKTEGDWLYPGQYAFPFQFQLPLTVCPSHPLPPMPSRKQNACPRTPSRTQQCEA